jgi:hypothetical protein
MGALSGRRERANVQVFYLCTAFGDGFGGQEPVENHGLRFSAFYLVTCRVLRVCFTPESGHLQCKMGCPLWAKSRHLSALGDRCLAELPG